MRTSLRLWQTSHRLWRTSQPSHPSQQTIVMGTIRP